MSERSEALTEILARRGRTHLCEHPGAVYQELQREFVKDGDTARLALMVLHTLLAKVPEREETTVEELSAYIRDRCCLEAAAADEMANLYLKELPAKERQGEGESKPWGWQTEKAYAEFCGTAWTFSLDVRVNWAKGRRFAELACLLEARAEAQDPEHPTRALGRILQEDGPETGKDIFVLLRNRLQSLLQECLRRYAAEEMGDTPTLDTFGFDDVLDAFCASYGLICLDRKYSRYVFPKTWPER